MSLRTFRAAPLAWAALFCWLGSAQAAVITQTATNLGGAVWRYDFELSGAALGAGDGFTVYFPLASVTALSNPLAPADWDAIVLDPDSPPGADGAFDALALTGAPSSSPFSVEATISGSTPPSGLRFEIYRFDPFEILESGSTTDPGGATVPEPSGLLATGLLSLAAAGRWRRRLPR